MNIVIKNNWIAIIPTFFWIRDLFKFDQNVQSEYKICSKIYGSFLRHNCKNKIYLEGLRKCTSLKVFRHLFYYSAINYWTDYIFLCIQIQIFKTCIYKLIANNFILFSNAESTIWFMRIYILPSFHLIMIQMPELDMPHYEPNNNTGIEK